MEWDKKKTGVEQKNAEEFEKGFNKNPEWVSKVKGLFGSKKEKKNPVDAALESRSETTYASGE